MSEFLETLRAISPILVCLLVCAAKIVEITIQSLKTCMMVKGQRLKAACLGFVECTIWGLVISTLIGTLGDNLLLLVFYCAGYATGLFLGSTLKEMATQSSVLAWRIPGTGEPGGLLSMGSHRVGHD